jgi:hypothetical protein
MGEESISVSMLLNYLVLHGSNNSKSKLLLLEIGKLSYAKEIQPRLLSLS